jgi:hypothetical protein
MSSGGLLVLKALTERKRGRYAEAVSTLKSIISGTNVEAGAKRWAVRMLLVLSRKVEHANVSQYLSGLQTTEPEFTRAIASVMPSAFLSEGDVVRAMSAYDQNILRYPNSKLEVTALYEKFIHALYRQRNLETASSLLERLRARYGDHRLTELAGVQFENTSVQAGTVPSIAGNGAVQSTSVPRQFSVGQNYPNPFNPTTTITYSLPADGRVSLKLYDVLGREVLTLVDEVRSAGDHQVSVDAGNLSSGVYLYKLTAGYFTTVRKMVLLK